ncbi:cobalamin-binding protein [Ideonella sp. 4Y11]|uniref:Cobalamin-binding protein n=1 Tax=Ideonella aquatica TaxID=2824119 RepID=A0A940YNY1_9BURK|nr:helical backbone metal receptor [Ideonella aquatica]MBQ0959821.1 cobalamin-binding protein [Ideonella aquatica]
MSRPRIASLVPSLTELVCTLGLRSALVARTGFCIHPGDLAEVPKVGGTKDVHLERLRALRPTHVLVNVDENRLETVQALRDFVPEVIITHPCAPEDNLALYAQFAQVFGDQPGVRDAAARLADALHTELDATRPGRLPVESVWVPIWREPWMTVARDTYISRLLARLDWTTLPGQLGGPTGAARYPVMTGTEPWLATVRRVLLPSEPYRFDERHLAEVQALCPQARVRLVDGEWLSWYGPRAAQALRHLRALRESP